MSNNKQVILGFFIFSLISTYSYAGPSEDSLIIWSEWSPEVFVKAKQQNKMLLVNVGIEVCFACRWMEEGTYQIPEVADLVNTHFVPIQVDANARPDLGERYSDWAWPATIFLAPDGTQVLGVRGSRRPRNFLPILNTLIEKHSTGNLEPDALAPYAAPSVPEDTELSLIRDKIRLHLDDDFDDAAGGWGDELKEIDDVGRNEQIMFRAVVYKDKKAEKRFVQTAYAMALRMDPVWGGFYAAGFNGWSKPIPEKRAGAQASALLTFAWAYQITGDEVFLHAAENVDQYLSIWMVNSNGTFYTSQEDQPVNLPEHMQPLDYFARDDEGRRKLGIPPVDHAVYTDINARLIRAYAYLYEVTLNQQYLDRARNAAKALLDERIQNDGWITMVTHNERLTSDSRVHKISLAPRPYLRAQAHFGNALLTLAKVTGEKHWVDYARRLANGMFATLHDTRLGGFYGAPSEGTDHAAAPRKPLEDNGVAARFLFQLGHYIKSEKFKVEAERAVRAVSVKNMLNREGRIVGNLAVALETLSAGYVEFTVVGDPDQPKAKALFEAARSYPEPRKILTFEKPGRYPDSGTPSLYICSADACSVPIFEPDQIAKHAKRFEAMETVHIAAN